MSAAGNETEQGEAGLLARLEALEIRVAYGEQTVEDLNTALTGQWAEIERLRREVSRLEGELRDAQAAGPDGLPEPPPPHY